MFFPNVSILELCSTFCVFLNEKKENKKYNQGKENDEVDSREVVHQTHEFLKKLFYFALREKKNVETE